MQLELEAFEPDRFLGPIELQVWVFSGPGRGAPAQVKKGFKFLASTYGLNCHDLAGGAVEIRGPGSLATPGVERRRRIAGWLMGLDVVESLTIRRTTGQPAFTVVIEPTRAWP